MNTIDIVFDGPPSNSSGRFVDVERDGRSISLGEWVYRPDSYWALRIPDPIQTVGGAGDTCGKCAHRALSEEARDLVRVLQLAIATTAEYQDAQEKAALQDAAMARPQKEG